MQSAFSQKIEFETFWVGQKFRFWHKIRTFQLSKIDIYL